MMKKLGNRGVTIIELLVLLVIVGILSGLVISTHAGITQKENNTSRQRDIDELRDELEAYYSRYTKYPTLNQINDPGWRSNNMKGLSREVLRDPSSDSYQLAASPAKHVYAYTVTSASGKACDNIKTNCTQYTLTATLQGGGTYVKNNLN
jgi:type II secretory pathway pseudopilin PulG